jgi:beta-lactamase class A
MSVNSPGLTEPGLFSVESGRGGRSVAQSAPDPDVGLSGKGNRVSGAGTDVDWSPVEREIAAVAVGGGLAGVAVIGPDGNEAAWHGDQRFRAASTIKIAVMVEVFRQIERNQLAHDDIITLTDGDRVPGSGVLLHLHDGLGLTVDDLLYLMISISDNTATNLLIDLTGLEGINQMLADLGLATSRMNRRMLGRTPREDEPENWVNPAEMARLMQLIVTDRAASPPACLAMRELLAKQQCQTRIARHLPDGTVWGSKTGSLPGVVNDVGFVTTDQGTLSIACFISGLDELAGEAAIGAITRAVIQTIGMLPAD